MRRLQLLVVVAMCTVAFQAGISRSTTLPTPVVDFRAADYVAGATSWTNRGSGGGTGTIPTGGMSKTTSGVDAVIFGGIGSGDSVSASVGSTSSVDKVTVEMWIKLLDNGSTQNASGSMLFSWIQPTSSFNYNVYHTLDNVGLNTFRSELYGVSSASYTNEWIHLVVIMSDTGAQTEQKIYVDGILKSSSCLLNFSNSTDSACTNTGSGRVFNASGNFVLMDNPFSSNAWLARAQVARVRVYTQELTASEVLAAYNATNSLPTVTTTSTSTTTSSTSSTTSTTSTTTTTAPASTTTVQSSTTTSPVTPPSSTTTSVTTSPSTTNNAAPQVTAPATATGGPSTAPASSTTTPPRQASPATTTTASPPPTSAPTPTTSTTTTTTSVPVQPSGNAPVDEVPELASGESKVTIGGRSVDVAVRRDGDTLTASFGEVTLQMSVVTPDGAVRSLGDGGVLTLDPGSVLSVAIAGLEPESTFEGWIYSDPVLLGQARASTGGIVEEALAVPRTVEPGRHTVVFSGTESSGEPFLFYGAVQSGDPDASSRWFLLVVMVPLLVAGVAGVFLPPVLRRRRT